MAKYLYVDADVSSAFPADVDVSQVIREALATEFGNVPKQEEPSIGSVHMVSDSAFSVQFNDGVIVDATQIDSEYVADYEGFFDRIVFDDSTTLTKLNIGYYYSNAVHHEITVASEPDGATLSVYGVGGVKMTADENGKYQLINGGYLLKSDSTADYDASMKMFVVCGEDKTETIHLSDAKDYAITFSVSPSSARVTVKDSNGVTIKPTVTGGKKYILEDSTVAGEYTYTVSNSSYVSSSGTIDAQGDRTITVSLKKLSSIAITTPPTKTEYDIGDVFDPTGMVVTATYNDESTEDVTDYTYEPSGELTIDDVEVTVTYTNGLTKTVTQAITVNEPEDTEEEQTEGEQTEN